MTTPRPSRSWPRGLVLALAGLGAAVTAFATSVIPPDFDQLVNESDYVVRAVVKSVASEYRPEGSGNTIITKVTLDVKEVLSGNPPSPLVLQMLGGTVGDDTLVVQGSPRFKVGDEDILFIKNNGTAISPLLAMMHGRYPILRDPATGRLYVARNNHTPLHSTAEISTPLPESGAVQRSALRTDDAMTPEEFGQRVRSAHNPAYVHKALN